MRKHMLNSLMIWLGMKWFMLNDSLIYLLKKRNIYKYDDFHIIETYDKSINYLACGMMKFCYLLVYLNNQCTNFTYYL